MLDFISDESIKQVEATIIDAGKKLLELWPGNPVNKGCHSLNVLKKTDNSFVTEADFKSNEMLVSKLKSLFPNDGILSEELPTVEGLYDLTHIWIIDPLDGTRSFINSRDDFAILVALCVNKILKWGVVYFPALQLFATATRGSGAKLNSNVLRVSNSQNLRDNSVVLLHFELPYQPCFYNKWMDSTLSFLNLCRGEIDGIILKIEGHQEWDIAAPAIVIEESGGVITDENGNRIYFNKGSIAHKYVVASNGRLHNELLKMIPLGTS